MKQLDAAAVLKFLSVMASLISTCGTTEQIPKENDSNSRSLSPGRSSCLVLVSTLDGKLAALDTLDNGELRWSIPAFSGPLLSSSLSKLQLTKHVRLVPSLDGGLYQVNGDKIEAVPYNADNLLGSFFQLPDGSMLIGAKEAKTCGIDPLTGKVRYVCESDGCKLTEAEDSHIKRDDVLVIKRTQQTMRAVDQRSGSERWNFSVGQQDLNFLEGLSEEDYDSSCPLQDDKFSPKWKLRVSIPDGLVAAVHREAGGPVETILWSHKFEAPVAAVWTLNDGHLKSVDLFREDVMPEVAEGADYQEIRSQKPMMYIGSHEGQVYIQSPQSLGSPISSDVVSVNNQETKAVIKLPKIVWRPYLASSPSRTPTIVSKEIAVWNPVEYPFDNGYYLFGEVKPFIPPHQRRGKNGFDFNEENATFEPRATQDIMDPKGNFWDTWRGMLALGIVAALIVQLFLRFFGRYRQRKELAEEKDLQRMQSTSVTTLTSTASLETLKAPSSPSFPSSPGLPDMLTSSNSFSSRYITDFEHELCLGKGGFGVVFQAKNKLDDCQYAIKRIRLPNCEEARSKVMREVKALAKLSEHPGIVRYYNAWFEAPPAGWQEDVDKQIYEEYKSLGGGETMLFETEPGLMSVSSGSGIFMNDCCAHNDDVSGVAELRNENAVRRRKKASSGSRSRHSSKNSSICDDPLGKRFDLISGADDLSLPNDISQLENEAIDDDQEESGSFSIEFASNSKSGGTVMNGYIGHDTSASQSIVFTDSSGISELTPEMSSSLEGSDSRSSKDSNSSMSLSCATGTHWSLYSGLQHRCNNKECTQDRLAAPLYLYIQMQLCQRQSLKDWLRINTDRDHLFCLQVFEQIVGAVEFFHGHGMMHRDLKPSNIFFSMDGTVKVGDFGLVTASHSVETNLETAIIGKNGITDVHHTGQVGTQLYMSPEQADGRVYSYKVDVYSMGLIFFEMFHPFSTQMERIKVLSDVKRNTFPSYFEAEMSLQTQLVKWMLCDSPKSRPNVAELRKCELMKEITKRAQENLTKFCPGTERIQ